MIYGNSTDPVLIKKIELKIWTLRDELEAVIATRFSDVKNPPSIEDLVIEYNAKGEIPGGDQTVKDASELDDFGEDEMAKAIAEAEAQENAEEAQDTENTEDDEEAQAQAAAAAMLGEASQQEPDNIIKLETAPIEEDGKVIVKQRTPLIPEEKTYHGRAILAEIYMDQMYFFSSQEFLEGQSIVLEFLVPKRFLMNANVVFCRTYNMKSRIISKNRLPYRVGIKFSYLKEGERTVLRNFVSSIEPNVEVVAQQASDEAPKESGGGDEFDIFDDLD